MKLAQYLLSRLVEAIVMSFIPRSFNVLPSQLIGTFHDHDPGIKSNPSLLPRAAIWGQGEKRSKGR